MADLAAKVEVLVVQFWLHDVKPIRAALEATGLTVTITRVDIPGALDAALVWGRYDVVIYDPQTPTLTRHAVADCLRKNGCSVPVVDTTDLATLGHRVRVLLGRAN